MNKYEYLKLIGERLRCARKVKGLPLRELDAWCEIDHGTLSRIETGKLNITMATLIKLTDALRINPAEVVNLEPTPVTSTRKRGKAK